MYNEDVKKRFIIECVSPASASACISMFDFIEKYENEWGADLCTKSAEELQPVVDKTLGLMSKSRFGRMKFLREYVRWCFRNNIPGAQDGMSGITDVGLEKVKTQTVANPKHLQSCLDAVFLPEDMETTDNLLRGYYWFAYAGFLEDDIFELTSSDIDLYSMSIYYKRMDRYLPIYDEGFKAIKNCKELTDFCIPHPNYTEEVRKPRIYGDLIMRGTRSDWGKEGVRVNLSRKSKEMKEITGTSLSHHRVWMSGIFYRAREIEKFRFEPDFSEYVYYQMRGKEYKSISGETKRNRLLKEINEDYTRWKLAWNIE